jgi:hypothetical protein
MMPWKEMQRFRTVNSRELRTFGLVVGGVFVLLAAVLRLPWWQKAWGWWPLVPGVPLMLLGAALPRSLRWLYAGWMTLAVVIGAMVSTVLLTLVFYLVVTPVGLAARLAGRDFLSRKLDSAGSSYWILRNPANRKEKHEHARQF